MHILKLRIYTTISRHFGKTTRHNGSNV